MQYSPGGQSRWNVAEMPLLLSDNRDKHRAQNGPVLELYIRPTLLEGRWANCCNNAASRTLLYGFLGDRLSKFMTLAGISGFLAWLYLPASGLFVQWFGTNIMQPLWLFDVAQRRHLLHSAVIRRNFQQC